MDFTDKTQETLAAAIQQAKDNAHAQGKYYGFVIAPQILINAP